MLIAGLLAVLISLPALLAPDHRCETARCKASYSIFGYELLLDPQVTPCLGNYHVFLMRRMKREDALPHAGEVWAFYPPENGFYPRDQLMVKIVGGVPGDEIVIAQGGVFINGTLMARGYKAADNLGVSQKLFYRSHVLAPGEYFMLGTSDTSFDSRYFGRVHETKLVGRAYPLF